MPIHPVVRSWSLALLAATFTLLVSSCMVEVRQEVQPNVASQAAGPDLGAGRISLVRGDAQIQGEGEQDWSLVSINLPLREGDRYWIPAGGRLEIQFQDGTALRLDGETSLDVLRFGENQLQIHLAEGRLYFHTGLSRSAAVQVELAAGTLLPQDHARFAVDRFPDAEEEISVFQGSLLLDNNGEQTLIGRNERFTWSGQAAETSALNPPDEWAHWNFERDRREYSSHRAYLPPELSAYEAELDEYGDWVHTDYGYAWKPRAVEDGWAPYRLGRWAYINNDYVWVSRENWGWIPYHYGRWAWTSEGWCWVPPVAGDVYWGPGYVGWIRTPTQVAWVPLAPHEVYYGYGHYGRDSVNLSERSNVAASSSYQYASRSQAVSGVPQNNFATVHSVPAPIHANSITPGAGQPVGRPPVNAATTSAPIGLPAPANAQPKSELRSVSVSQLRQRHPQLAAAGTNQPRARTNAQTSAPKANAIPNPQPGQIQSTQSQKFQPAQSAVSKPASTPAHATVAQNQPNANLAKGKGQVGKPKPSVSTPSSTSKNKNLKPAKKAPDKNKKPPQGEKTETPDKKP